MKRISKLLLAALMLVTIFALTGCGAKEVEVNLADYVKYTYEGYDGMGTGEAEIDARKIARDIEEEIGEEKASDAQRILKKIDVTLAKIENLSNGESVAVSFDNVNEDTLKEECGVIVKAEGFDTTVSGLTELEEVDLFADYEIKFSGNDTLGYAYVNHYNFPEGVYGVYLDLEKKENLSNGEKVKLVAKDYDDGDVVKTLAEEGKKAKALEYEVTVSGLTELVEYDIFQGIEMNYEGLNGHATATLRFDYNVNDYYYSFEFLMDKSEELSNGDIITVTCDMDDYYKDEYADINTYAAQRGIKLTATTKQVTVEGILAPIADTSEIDSTVFEQMKADDIEKIKTIYTDGYENVAAANSFLDAKYIGSLITFKNSSYYDYANKIINVYKCDIKYADTDPVWIYWCSVYTTDRDETTGQYTVSEIEAVTPAEFYKYYAYSDDFACYEDENKNIYLGFTNVDDVIKAFTDDYRGDSNAEVIFNNIADTEEPHADGTVTVEKRPVELSENPIDISKENEGTKCSATVNDAYNVYTEDQANALLEKAYFMTDYICNAEIITVGDLESAEEESFQAKCDQIYAEKFNGTRALIYMIDANTLKDYMYLNDGSDVLSELEPELEDTPYSFRSENPYEYTVKIFDTLIAVIGGNNSENAEDAA